MTRTLSHGAQSEASDPASTLVSSRASDAALASTDASRGLSGAPKSPGKLPAGDFGVSVQPQNPATEHTKNVDIKQVVASRRTAPIITSRKPSFPRFSLLAGLSAALSLGACSMSSGEAPPLERRGPGRVVDSLIACQNDGDCQAGEACGDGVCQMRRCGAGSYTSRPPLGKSGYAYTDRTFLTAKPNSILALQPAAPGSLGKEFESKGVIDVAGGNVTGRRPEAVVYVSTSSTKVHVLRPEGETSVIEIGWQGNRIATGDTNDDGVDEILVASKGKQYAICDAINGTCTQRTFDLDIDDVAIGDVDDDGFGELVFLSKNTLTFVNTNADETGEPTSQRQALVGAGFVEGDVEAIAVGDLDGGGAEIIALKNAWFGDKLIVYGQGLGGGITEKRVLEIPDAGLDVAFAKVANAGRIGLLLSGETRVYSLQANKLVLQGQVPLPFLRDVAPRRLAAVDLAGRSAAVRLREVNPVLMPGPAVPIAVMTLPPYSATHSSGPSSVTLGTNEEFGTTEQVGESQTRSVSLTASIGIGIGCKGSGSGGVSAAPASGTAGGPAGTPSGSPPAAAATCLGPSLRAYVTQSTSRSLSRSKSATLSTSIGSSYSLTAEPQADGYDSGGVVLAGVCFHRYDYELDDPAHVLDGEPIDLSFSVPVGGETTLWSARRYNALADALPEANLPKINIPYRLGSISSYPDSPATLDGEKIARADNVFPNAPILHTSDVGAVSFSLTSSESTTNTEASSFSYGSAIGGEIGASIALVNVSVQGTVDTNRGLEQSYSVMVGKSTQFSGHISPMRDDPSTAGNEAEIYAYSFQPVVYRHHFKTEGKDGAFYVLTYAVPR